MVAIQITLLIIYGVSFFFIFLYSLIQLHLVILYVRSKYKSVYSESNITESDFPFVTVQLPIFNEMYVVERLINAVAQFDYPKDRFEIHVLDDSNDETLEITAKKVSSLQRQGYQIEQVTRNDRTGYKAGALAKGLEKAKGEFIAIFDADFIPTSDFLQRTLPYFKDKNVGLVQTKWDHINKNYSLLTKLQAFGLDAHFSVEQTGRNSGDHFINFNGTAGIWRKSCIIDGDGWHHDTLTEDLDLSYRAQMKGWKFKFLEDVRSPAELPATIDALKTQQFRWTKGGAETAKKNLITVLRSKIPLSSKVHAIFHLMNSTVFISILITALLSIPILFIKSFSPEFKLFFDLAPILMLSLLFLSAFYWTALYQEKKNVFSTTWNFLPTFPLFLSISMGLSLHNSIAVVEGYLGFKSPFIRTPKFRIENTKDTWNNKKYFSTKITYLTIMEGLLALYFIGGIYFALQLGEYGFLPFHGMLSFGFSLIFFYTIKQSLTSK